MEANIIYRISKGEERAMEVFMDTYSSVLYGYAYGILGIQEIAEEVVSDVFFDIWKNRKHILEIENLGGYLRTLTYRKSITALRREQARPESDAFSLDDFDAYSCAPIEISDEESPEQEQVENLHEAIEQLPPKCRHVFYLAKIDKVPYKEIAELLSISVATINYHVSTAMDHLRQRLRKPPD